MFDLDHAPVVLKGPTWQSPMMMAAGIAMAIVSVLVWRLTRSNLIGGVSLFAAVWAFGVGVFIRNMPIRLTVAEDGLTYVNLGVCRSWRWSEVDSFDTTHVKTAWLISFRDYAKDPKGRPFYLPTHWDAPRNDVLALLQRAQARWGGQP